MSVLKVDTKCHEDCCTSLAGEAETAMSVVDKGKAVAFDRKKGNCLACHAMDEVPCPAISPRPYPAASSGVCRSKNRMLIVASYGELDS